MQIQADDYGFSVFAPLCTLRGSAKLGSSAPCPVFPTLTRYLRDLCRIVFRGRDALWFIHPVPFGWTFKGVSSLIKNSAVVNSL